MIRAAILAPTPGNVSSSADVAVFRLTTAAGLADRESARVCELCAITGAAARIPANAHTDKTIRNIVPPCLSVTSGFCRTVFTEDPDAGASSCGRCGPRDESCRRPGSSAVRARAAPADDRRPRRCKWLRTHADVRWSDLG